MQTFLPYEDFTQSAKVLDDRRLGKQRVEGYQILKALLLGPYQCTVEKEHPIGYLFVMEGHGYVCEDNSEHKLRKRPWYNHPATLMWKGYELGLVQYIFHICHEWTQRGKKDNIRLKTVQLIRKYEGELGGLTPPWLGDPSFHAAHRSNLLRKNSDHYKKFGWTEPDNLSYIWPGRKKK